MTARTTFKRTREMNRQWERFKDRYYDWLRLPARRTAIIILLIFAALAAYSTIPEATTSFLPTRESDVGRVMKFIVRADRDYDVVDEEATVRNREAALGKVPRHFVYRDNTERYRTIRRAFAAMRDRAVAVLLDKGIGGSHDVPAEFMSAYRDVVERHLPDLVPESLRGAVFLALEDERKSFEKAVGAPVPEEVFALLRSAFFSPEIEEAVFDIIGRLDSYYILRAGVGEGYRLDKIMVRRGNSAPAQRPRYRVITTVSLPAEIERAQKALEQEKLFSEKGLALVAAVVEVLLADNLSFDEEANGQARAEVERNTPPVIIKVKNGEIVARPGERITKHHLAIFRAIVERKGDKPFVLSFVEHFLFIIAVVVIGYVAFRRSVSKFSIRNKDLLLMAVLALLSLLLSYLITAVSVPFSQWMGTIDPRTFNFLLPFPFIVATVRLLINTETALFFLITLTLLFATVFPDNFYFPVYYAASSLFYLFLITHVERRSHALRVSLSLAGVQMALVFLIFLLDASLPRENMIRALLTAFTSGIFSALLLLGLLPLWESFFGYTTDISYLELTSMQHPLMARLVSEANGSYQHSLMVGVMVEDAARRIRVNPLACKVMAYYHDIGKLQAPHCYSENQSGMVNVHDSLDPLESARIIARHVTYGLELARNYKLGDRIETAIQQHHGTSLVKYFYEKALQKDPQTPEEPYRYPGPRPQSKEVALIMLADSVEAAIRSMKEKTYQKIQEGVHNIIERIIDDGQLSESALTMRDLSLIKESFVKTLSGQYHARVEYQQPVA